jgi:hypothetical protein
MCSPITGIGCQKKWHRGWNILSAATLDGKTMDLTFAGVREELRCLSLWMPVEFRLASAECGCDH